MSRDFNNRFGHHLRVMRVDACMTQEQLAKEAGVNVGVIIRYENGAGGPLLKTACKLADALGCTPNDLVEFLAKPKPKRSRKGGAK